MQALNLEKSILDNRGEEIVDVIADEKGKTKKVKRTLREDLLKVLGVQYDSDTLADPKQYTWIYHLSNQFNGKEKTVEVSDEKSEFLRKLVKLNKAIVWRQGPRGPEKIEIQLFMPFEVGQLLILLGEKEE